MGSPRGGRDGRRHATEVEVGSDSAHSRRLHGFLVYGHDYGAGRNHYGRTNEPYYGEQLARGEGHDKGAEPGAEREDVAHPPEGSATDQHDKGVYERGGHADPRRSNRSPARLRAAPGPQACICCTSPIAAYATAHAVSESAIEALKTIHATSARRVDGSRVAASRVDRPPSHRAASTRPTVAARGVDATHRRSSRP